MTAPRNVDKWIGSRSLATAPNARAAIARAFGSAGVFPAYDIGDAEAAAVRERDALVAVVTMPEATAARFRSDVTFANRLRAELGAVGCNCELVTLWTLHVTIR